MKIGLAQVENHHMHIKEQGKDQTILIKHNNWQLEEKTHMWGPHQSLIYLAWIRLTIPLFWNYENCIHAYVKSRETEDYLKTGVKLKLFERKLDFWNLFENWSLENYLKMDFLKINKIIIIVMINK